MSHPLIAGNSGHRKLPFLKPDPRMEKYYNPSSVVSVFMNSAAFFWSGFLYLTKLCDKVQKNTATYGVAVLLKEMLGLIIE